VDQVKIRRKIAGQFQSLAGTAEFFILPNDEVIVVCK
jgi:hypothetical protein